MSYIIGWVILSATLLFFTLSRNHPYRFTRFLAFECLLSLIFLNASAWFKNPFSIQQIISWTLLVTSFMLAAHGFFLLKRRGHPEGDLEDTTVLITSGAYKYIRHPLYTSLLIFGLGAFIKNPSWLGVLLVGLTILGVTLTAIREETHNIARFGEEYLSYMENTKRFIPYLY